jgi:hypothetical protein
VLGGYLKMPETSLIVIPAQGESRFFKVFCTPAFAGATVRGVLQTRTVVTRSKISLPVKFLSNLQNPCVDDDEPFWIGKYRVQIDFCDVVLFFGDLSELEKTIRKGVFIDRLLSAKTL